MTDKSTPYRMIIAARCPTGAPPEIVEAWTNFMAAINGVRQRDAEREGRCVAMSASNSSTQLTTFFSKRYEVVEWASRSDGALDKPYDIMQLRLAPTYEAPVC